MADDRDTILAADRLARLLGDQRGTETLHALRNLADARRPPAPAGLPDDGPAPRQRTVGVWEIVGTDTGPGLRAARGVRPEERSLWADVDEVPGKGDARRVVLVGESAARGYLLDPVFNPAQALRRHLDAAGGRAHQCVDLARTNLLLPGLRHLVRQVPHLDADVLVVFAGNNWTASAYGMPQRSYTPAVVDALRHGGYPAMRTAVLTGSLLPAVRAALTDLVRLRDREGVEVVVVIPEFNLTGWSPLDAVGVPEVPSLPDGDLMEWYDLRDRVVPAAGRGDWPQVRAAARRMAELDRGTSPLPGYLLGRALEAAGEYAAARTAYEDARDAMCGLPLSYSPRTPRMLRDLLRDVAGSHGIATVDLSDVLGRTDAPQLPDPAHFLDYCHLSDTGIDLAMAEVARHVHGTGPEGGGPPDRWGSAVSLLLAAVFNALHGQPADVVRRYLRGAVAAGPRMTGLLESLCQVLDRPGGPLWSGTGFDRLISEPIAASVFARFADVRSDAMRLWTLRDLLAEHLGGTAGPPEPAGKGPRELLELTALRGAVPNYTAPRCFLPAHTRTTGIRFLLAGPTAGALSLTYRHRGGHPAPATVLLNGAELGKCAASTGWSTTRFPVPPESTRGGPNLVEVVWSGPAISHEQRVALDAESLARGEQPYVLPVFGELFSVVFDAGETARDPGEAPPTDHRSAPEPPSDTVRSTA